MKRLFASMAVAGGVALALACEQAPPTSSELLCQRYCQGQLQAVPTAGATSCESPASYFDSCVDACQEDIGSIRADCRTQLLQAYACGADHTWFCIPKEGGGRTLTQLDTCREPWDMLYVCERGTPDAGLP
jgi:hypothetical protein